MVASGYINGRVYTRDAEAEAEAEAEAGGSGTFAMEVEAEAEAEFWNSLEAEAAAQKATNWLKKKKREP